MPATDIDEQTFERSMAEMSLAALKSKAPALVDYVMGFQLVEKNDDDTRAFGFFAFKIGKQWVYGPVFFLTGEVKGLEMMYVKEQNIFMPMEEGWVNYLIKRKPHVLGGPQNQRNQGRLGISQPDLRLLVRPPQATKLGSDRWLVDEIANCIAAGTKVADSMAPIVEAMTAIKTAELPERMQLPRVLAANGLTKGFLEQCKQQPKLAASVLRFYGMKDFAEAEEKVAAFRKQAAALSVAAEDEPKPVLIMDRDDAVGDLGRAKWLTEDEKKQIMRGNVVTRDGRPEEETRKVYRFESTYGLENPQEGGLYDMLTPDGGMAKVLILKPRMIGHGAAGAIRMVVDPVTNTFRASNSSGIFTGHKYMRDEFEAYLEEHGSAVTDDAFALQDDLQDGWDSQYVVVGPNGEAIIPFRVQQKFQSVDGQTTMMVHPSDMEIATNDQVGHERREETNFMPFEGLLHDEHGIIDIDDRGEQNYRSSPGSSYQLRDRFRIILTDKPIKRPVAKGSTLLLPRGAGFKVFRLKQSAGGEIDPGTTADLFMRIEKSAEQLKVYNDGIHLDITYDGGTSRARSEKQALNILCNDLGVSVKEAQNIYKEAKAQQTSRTARYWVARLTQKQAAEKLAGPFDIAMVNRSMRQDPMIDANIEESFGDITTQPADYRSKTDPGVYKHVKDENNYHAVYQRDIDMINQAAESGQKDVFDSAALGALINVNDINQELDTYAADMVKALDKLGRTLFLMYWHQEEVQDRYGKQAVTDLQDNVRSTFQSLGDVILDMKQKSPIDSDAFGRGILNIGAN